jgi:transposase-like protein
MSESETTEGATAEAMEFEIPVTCPRCGADRSSDVYYGVCESCRTELRTTFSGEARSDVEEAAYEPKMNVTPNAVALKE